MLGAIIIVVVVVVLAVAGFLGYYFSPAQRQKRARKRVAEAIKDCDGIVYNNYKVVVDGDETKIDLIYIGESGMYVAKVMMEEGKIFSDNMSKEWKRRYRGRDEKFPSPVKDKDKLVVVLRNIIPTDYQIYSCVVFMNADVKDVRCTSVLTLEGLKNYIKERPKMLTQNQRDDLKKILDDYKKSL